MRAIRPWTAMSAGRQPSRRLPATVFALVSVAASLLSVVLPASAAYAGPLSSTPLITANLQGARAGGDNKWSTTVATYARAAEIVGLQEAGPEAPGRWVSNIAQPHLPQIGDQGFVQHHQWTPYRESYEVYFLQTDRTGGTYQGGRVNMALVTQRPADEVYAVPNPIAGGRPALGVRFGDDWYFTFHGFAGTGADSAGMLRAVEAWVNGRGRGEEWTVMADFNIDPGHLVTPAVSQTYRTHQATHENGSEYDYVVSSTQIQDHPVRRQNGAAPDHYAVAVGAMRGGAETVQPKIMPTGDSITYGYNSSTGNGYRERLFDLLSLDTLMRRDLDFVGSQQSGDMEDAEHQGHPGWRIDQIADIVDCTVPRSRPNIVTLHAGTNDMNQDYLVDTAPDRLGALIDQILADAPEATVLVSTLVPSTKSAVQPRIVEFNRRVPELVAQRRAAGKHVLLVDMGEVTTDDLADQLHPNDSGYAKMADAFYRGVLQAELEGWVTDPVPTAVDAEDGCAADGGDGGFGGGWGNVGEVFAASEATPTEGWTNWADINGDGRDDRLTLHDSGALDAQLNTAGTGAKPQWQDLGRIAPGVGEPGLYVHIADVNGDGRADYLVTDPAGPVRAWLNTPGDGGKPSWSSWGEIAPGVGASLHEISFADVNGDRRADYLVTGTSGAVRAWLNTPGDGGKPSWYSWGEIAGVPDVSPGQIRFTDINADRRADFLAVAVDGGVRAWLNTPGDGGKPSWSSLDEIARVPGVTSSRIEFAHVNGDGRSDFLASGADGAVDAWLNTPGNGGKPSWESLGGIVAGNALRNIDAVQFADINGDGFDDCLRIDDDSSVTAQLSTSAVSNVGIPTWGPPQIIATGVGVPGDLVRFADINGDGRDDYLVLKNTGVVDAWLNTPGDGGKPSWSSWGQIASGVGAPGEQIRFADLDGDKRADYLVVADNGSVRAWRNTPGNGGKPSWSSWGTYAAGVTGAQRDMIRFADINADGRADYLKVDEAGVIEAWINNGGESGGGWTNRGVFAVGVGATRDRLRLADISRDGKADYLVVSTDGSVNAWINKGGDPV